MRLNVFSCYLDYCPTSSHFFESEFTESENSQNTNKNKTAEVKIWHLSNFAKSYRLPNFTENNYFSFWGNDSESSGNIVNGFYGKSCKRQTTTLCANN